MENIIEVESAEVAMDISLEDDIIRNDRQTKISYWSRIIKQFVPSLMSELVLILLIVANVMIKLIINARFYHHISYITLLRGKRSMHAQIAHLAMFPV